MSLVSNVSEEFKTRIRFPMSDREMERRWGAIQTKMQEKGVDVLIAQNDNQYLGGYVRYLTDMAVEQAYPVSVLFPAKGKMTTITSASPANPLPPEWFTRGIGTRLGAPYFRTFNYTDLYDAKLMEQYILDNRCKVVGWIAPSLLNSRLVGYLTKQLPNVEFVDFTDDIDEIKAVKSEDEIAAIRRTVLMHDKVFGALPAIIRPNMYEYEVRAEINKILINLGSEENLVMMGSTTDGTLTPQIHSFYQNKKIEDGDDILVMVEANGGGGYYAEIVRTFCIGHKPSKELQEAWAISRDMQHFTADLMRPGADCEEMLNKVNDQLASYGLPPETRLFAHGQGYDLVERPAFFKGETMKVKENMFFAIHPQIVKEKAMGNCCDQFLITENGAERVEVTPQEIFII